MAYSSQTYAFFIQALPLLSIAVLEVNAVNYASVNSDDGKFELKWTYNNMEYKLMFKMKCKGTGWCAVGFSTDPGNGGGMKNYDIAVGGVTSAGVKYLADYWSASAGAPDKDATQNLNLTTATEADGYTNVEFYRAAMTGDTAKDVQFKNDTTVYIMWAFNSNTDADVAGAKLNGKHANGDRKLISGKHNLIMIAMSAAMQPSTTTMMLSTSMMSYPSSTTSKSTTGPTPSPTPAPTSSPTPAPTPTPTTNAASEAGSRVVAFAILTLFVGVLSF